MRAYVKPVLSVFELRAEEGFAAYSGVACPNTGSCPDASHDPQYLGWSYERCKSIYPSIDRY